ncbi:MAG: DUF4878 domain-containing protein [Burkholderiaceae bacterium]|jgi:hypothetical protein|nr:DUF4878 domain-containing protein [Burkholderiaceae bacterium]
MLLHRIFAIRFFMACLLGALVAACGTSSSSSPPESTVKDFYKAIADNRIDNAMALVLIEDVKDNELTAAQQIMLGMLFSEIEKDGGLKSIDTKVITQEGDVAVVEVTLTFGNGEKWNAGKSVLVKKDGHWKIQFI